MPTLREINVKYRFKEVECPITGNIIKEASDVAALFDFLKFETKEVFVVVNLTNHNEINCYEVVATGRVNAVSVRPAEIFRTAVIMNLNTVILIHNHPSGKPNPSQSDIEFTKRVIEAAKALDIRILDHLIIGLNCYESLQQSHPSIFR